MHVKPIENYFFCQLNGKTKGLFALECHYDSSYVLKCCIITCISTLHHTIWVRPRAGRRQAGSTAPRQGISFGQGCRKQQSRRSRHEAVQTDGLRPSAMAQPGAKEGSDSAPCWGAEGTLQALNRGQQLRNVHPAKDACAEGSPARTRAAPKPECSF